MKPSNHRGKDEIINFFVKTWILLKIVEKHGIGCKGMKTRKHKLLLAKAEKHRQLEIKLAVALRGRIHKLVYRATKHASCSNVDMSCETYNDDFGEGYGTCHKGGKT